MSSCYHGKNGALSLGGTNIAMLTSWNLSQSVDTVECTSMQDTAKTYKAGIPSFEGSAEAVWTDDDNQLNVGSITIGTEYAAVFYVDDNATSAAELKYSGQVIVTGLEVSASMDDVVRATVNFQGTGALTVDDDTDA